MAGEDIHADWAVAIRECWMAFKNSTGTTQYAEGKSFLERSSCGSWTLEQQKVDFLQTQ